MKKFFVLPALTLVLFSFEPITTSAVAILIVKGTQAVLKAISDGTKKGK